MFIDEVEGDNRRIIDEAEGRVCNSMISSRHRVDKQYLTTSLVEIKDQTSLILKVPPHHVPLPSARK